MKFPIAAQLRQPGLTGSYIADVALPSQTYMGTEVSFAAPLHIEASYIYDGVGLTVKGTVKTALRSTCALCTREFEEPFVFAFEERFVKDPSPEDEAYPVGNEELDITRPVLDNLFLNLPLQSICRPDCKGLCPVCGCDLNSVQCACKPQTEPQKVNPFAKLSILLNHDKEV
ncbi:MAG: DUF177 domain-containing protein [Candidatus Pelethousia sp.]|nr:DUF177 domain-containing protein [Candidatus Pelethousia sp.]